MALPASPAAAPVDPELIREAFGWMVRTHSGPGDSSLHDAIRRWRQTGPAHEAAWQRALQVDRQMRHELQPVASDTAARGTLYSAPGRASRRGALKLFALGAGTVLPAVWLTAEVAPWQRLAADFATTTGERRRVVLGDGTELLLNTDTAVQQRFDDGQRLLVLARGEIALASGRDPASARARPLRVRSRDGLFEAIGTRFSVRLEPASSVLAVDEGLVAMLPRNAAPGQAPVVAAAGEAYSLTGDAVTARADNGLDPTGWTDGVLVARGIRLDDFLAELSRYRAGWLACDPAVAALRISGVFRLEDTGRVLAVLPQTLPVRLQYRSRYWVNVVPA